jgi:hypothetical protein
MFAVHDECSIMDIKKRNGEKCKMAKGWKIPIEVLEPEPLHIINGKCIFTTIVMRLVILLYYAN